MATRDPTPGRRDISISIHATHTGGDQVSRKTTQHQRNFNPRHPYGWRQVTILGVSLLITISIHATHTGGDWSLMLCSLFVSDFNPRHPYGWRQAVERSNLTYWQFQSTPPIRVATACMQQSCLCLPFQSTPPIRVATSSCQQSHQRI